MNLKEIFPFNFKIKLFIQLFIGFMIAVFIGTLSYSVPEYITAKQLGYDAKLHSLYASHGPGCKQLHATYDYLDSIRKKYPEEIKSKTDFPDKKKYDEVLSIAKTYGKDSVYINFTAIGFPIFIGTIALIFLFIFKRKYSNIESLKFKQWILIFLSLFWLRSAFNLWGTSIVNALTNHKFSFMDTFISYHYGWSPNVFPIVSGILGTIVLILVIFVFIPKQQRFTFILSGLFGGLSGFFLWFFFLGKHILP
jgi:hypothetical protein